MNSGLVSHWLLLAFSLCVLVGVSHGHSESEQAIIRDPQQLELLQVHDEDSQPSPKQDSGDGFVPQKVVESPSAGSEGGNRGSKAFRAASRKAQGQPAHRNTRNSLETSGSGPKRNRSLRHHSEAEALRQNQMLNRFVNYTDVQHQTGFTHEVRSNATVNMFRVNCRRHGHPRGPGHEHGHGRCHHHHRSDDFEPEIVAPGEMRGPHPGMKDNNDPFPQIRSHLGEEDLRRAVHDPTDELINHLTMFGKDRRVTLWVQQLFRQNRLPTIQNLMERIDQNFFVGSHHNIGNPRIRDMAAVHEMNFDQYFRHSQVTLGRTMHNQKLINDYGTEKTALRHMWAFRRTRQRVYESILQMESIIYLEQQTLSRNIRERRRRFDQDQFAKVNATMKGLEGKPYFANLLNRNDIFQD